MELYELRNSNKFYRAKINTSKYLNTRTQNVVSIKKKKITSTNTNRLKIVFKQFGKLKRSNINKYILWQLFSDFMATAVYLNF